MEEKLKSEELKTTIFKKGVKAVPNFIWAFCASYALFMGTNIVVLKFSDIDANQHISRYLDITLNAKESLIKSNTDLKKAIENQNLVISTLITDMNELKETVKHNTELAHEGGKQ